MKAYSLPLDLAELKILDELLEYEIESINNALYDGRICDTDSIKRRDDLRELQGTIITAIDYLKA